MVNTANSKIVAACFSVVLVIPAGLSLGVLIQQLQPLSGFSAAIATVAYGAFWTWVY